MLIITAAWILYLSQLPLELMGSRILIGWYLFGVVHSLVFLLEVRSAIYSFLIALFFCNLSYCNTIILQIILANSVRYSWVRSSIYAKCLYFLLIEVGFLTVVRSAFGSINSDDFTANQVSIFGKQKSLNSF
jgi:hypothetical protein